MIDILPDGTLSYTPNKEMNLRTVQVDTVTFKWVKGNGQPVIITKQFIVTRRGDVPTRIETGYGKESTGNSNYLTYLLIGSFIALASLVVRRVRREK